MGLSLKTPTSKIGIEFFIPKTKKAVELMSTALKNYNCFSYMLLL